VIATLQETAGGIGPRSLANTWLTTTSPGDQRNSTGTAVIRGM
jgi:hypothetical protein